MFLTATPYNAAFGGIIEANNNYSVIANKPSARSHKALLVDDINRITCTSVNCVSGGHKEQIDWVLAPNTVSVSINTSNFVFISDVNGVFTVHY